ncbi:hypothetical protein GCM10009555_015990 [Acrocarpospora macrocephala]|uniref:Uncharacterized protein n=1 Tax=Acrocarpospora macrocephala TaxID=150177 RepID=A0A5M3X8G2_9ACTN|nr:hypothetical protein Amac_093990 [Acrocarpospora macrocephala]
MARSPADVDRMPVMMNLPNVMSRRGALGRTFVLAVVLLAAAGLAQLTDT